MDRPKRGVLPPNTLTSEDMERADEEENARILEEELYRHYGPHGAVHKNLKRFREQRGMSKQEMAKLLEVTPRTYYGYENGHRAVPSNSIVQLAILTGGDLNEILMGRPAPRSAKATQKVIDEAIVVLRFLAMKYPDMDMDARYKIVRLHALADLPDLPRLHPDIIGEFVKIVTRHKYYPEDLPAPPDYDDFGDDHESYERAMAEWQQIVEEDFPKDKADNAS